jgi:KDO2-lipid IV(A) lauroyltransferase
VKRSEPLRSDATAPGDPPGGVDGAQRSRSGLLVRLLRFVILYAVLRPLVLLPYRFQLSVGRVLGRLARRLAKRTRWIVHCNLRACFPELSAQALTDLERRHFDALGMSAIEMTFGWWAAERRVRERIDFEGLEHYEAARAEGRNIIFLTAHFTTMELCAIALTIHVPHVHGVYRRYDKNPLADAIAREGRTRAGGGLIERDDVMGMVRVLRGGDPLWFASDQLVRPDKRSVVVPFFGVPCLVHAAVLDLARIADARVLPIFSLRTPEGRYQVTVAPALEDFPSGDRVADMTRVMKVIEDHVRRDPAQYMWVWRRFARRPPEYPDLYRR